jgi:hypothetical protein
MDQARQDGRIALTINSGRKLPKQTEEIACKISLVSRLVHLLYTAFPVLLFVFEHARDSPVYSCTADSA